MFGGSRVWPFSGMAVVLMIHVIVLGKTVLNVNDCVSKECKHFLGHFPILNIANGSCMIERTVWGSKECKNVQDMHISKLRFFCSSKQSDRYISKCKPNVISIWTLKCTLLREKK